jgi:hypothetical protein
MAQRYVLTFVKKGGISQHSQAAEPDQGGGITNKIDLALAEIRSPAAD